MVFPLVLMNTIAPSRPQFCWTTALLSHCLNFIKLCNTSNVCAIWIAINNPVCIEFIITIFILPYICIACFLLNYFLLLLSPLLLTQQMSPLWDHMREYLVLEGSCGCFGSTVWVPRPFPCVIWTLFCFGIFIWSGASGMWNLCNVTYSPHACVFWHHHRCTHPLWAPPPLRWLVAAPFCSAPI